MNPAEKRNWLAAHQTIIKSYIKTTFAEFIEIIM